MSVFFSLDVKKKFATGKNVSRLYLFNSPKNTERTLGKQTGKINSKIMFKVLKS
jgi:hypothetical protein